MGAFVEIDLIEEIHLDHPVIDQPTNRPALEGGDPADPVTTDAVIEGRITPVFSSETLAELQDVLARPRLQRFLTRAAIRPEALLARLALIADLVTPGTVTEHIRDPKDAPFVALVTTRPAPDLIVTGDSDFERDRYGGAPVVSASMLAAVLANQQGRIP
ncbi:putative toxin-antitoxin system toxin component, PIN family [Thiorhodococcus mannitoliphagus]|uniref:Putative toxin-antitoxin system toxin component, PIN family n=1 Tax=Thiorhodococcus mannitoliphagus TaxID=329406 RepID=A0A6P1DYD8_9GAMM|nr:putative toxin-antitoxin system toxin component, PIN family [Thiorhodococcus mannitoliphagus]NEX20724.1 putative toxin-antitoxin system toxin component, PIN family [Thiorhodococcus mannitoliphagus]